MGEAFNNEIKARLSKSKTLSEFMLYYYASNGHLKLGSKQSFTWMFDYGTPTLEDALESFVNKETREAVVKDAKNVEQMVPNFKSLKDKDGHIKMVLKRLRDKHGYYTYAVMVEFPKGMPADDPVLGAKPPEETVETPDMVYFKPIAACVLHACDDLFKIHRQEPFYTPYLTRNEAVGVLKRNEAGVNEYQLKRSPEGVEKQDAVNYILVGVHDAYNNEPYVVPVSRFKIT